MVPDSLLKFLAAAVAVGVKGIQCVELVALQDWRGVNSSKEINTNRGINISRRINTSRRTSRE